ncbi:MAG TPA: secretin N-terminal domain-containing protein [Sulfuricurvum sp.]|nr:secretin N-terminal domain-containing protein [Sulfuricurvum sp.]
MKSAVNLLIVFFLAAGTLHAARTVQNEKASIAIDGMALSDFIKLVARISNKNIFVTEEVTGKISYAGNRPIQRKELFKLLQTTLESRGMTMLDTGAGYYSIVKSADAASMNIPFLSKSDIPQLQTEIIKLNHASAESMALKVKNYSSKNGKIVPSKESNSLIVTDLPENVKTMRQLVAALDVRDETTANYTHLIQLKNADAKNLVNTLNTIIAKMTLSPGQQPPSITSDDTTNSLIIICSDDLYSILLPTIKGLDGDRQQVYVKAKIIEISENKVREVGVKYGLSGGTTGSNGIFSFDSQLGDGKVGAINVDPLLLSKISFPAISSGIALGASISLLNTNGAADILSEPSILCIDNQESSIYVGKTESISSGTTLSGSGLSQSSYTRQDIGLTLKIKPRLSNDNKVLLAVETRLEDIDATNTNLQLPSTTKREVKTSAIVSNGESVIIGGLIKDKFDRNNTKVPFFGDIPLLGNLFKNKGSSHEKINLVIILTPYILDKSSDLSALRTQLDELDKIQQRYIEDVLKLVEADQ